MTIEKLEALERAATAGPLKVYRHGVGGNLWNNDGNKLIAQVRREEDIALFIAMRESFPALLAVAKAAKAYCDQWPNASTAHANLVFAVAQLEATP